MATEANWLAQAHAAREKLETAFPGRVTALGDADYEKEVCHSWSVTSRNPATAYVHLDSAEEVAQALQILRSTGSKFAIRSAGHNANPGFSSVGPDGTGIVLDLRGLKSKVLDQGTNTAHLGAGNDWLGTYKWLEKENLTVIGSREGQVGVSGFLLGGGQGIISSRYGLGADGVKNFEVVLADGSIVNANAESHPDLFLALKGGGSNFGILTAVSLQVHPLMKLQYTINMYDPSDYENVLDAFAEVQKAMEVDPNIGMFINTRKGYIAVGLFYADWPQEFPAAFAPFTKLTSFVAALVPTSNGTFCSLNDILMQWAYREKDLKHAYCTMTTKISPKLYKQGHLRRKEVIQQLPDTVDLHWSIQPLTEAAVLAGENRGGNIMGLEKVPQSCWIFACDWKEDKDDEVVRKALSEVLTQVGELATDEGLKLDLLFSTFAGGSQNVLASFGAKSLNRLQAAAAKYDPDGIFQKLQIGGFLLRDA